MFGAGGRLGRGGAAPGRGPGLGLGGRGRRRRRQRPALAVPAALRQRQRAHQRAVVAARRARRQGPLTNLQGTVSLLYGKLHSITLIARGAMVT